MMLTAKRKLQNYLDHCYNVTLSFILSCCNVKLDFEVQNYHFTIKIFTK